MHTLIPLLNEHYISEKITISGNYTSHSYPLNHSTNALVVYYQAATPTLYRKFKERAAIN